MLIIDCFNHNIYIESKLVGYIGQNELIIQGKKFADITDDGIISFGEKEIGYIDDDLTIVIHDEEVGYVDADNNFVFYNNIGKIK